VRIAFLSKEGRWKNNQSTKQKTEALASMVKKNAFCIHSARQSRIQKTKRTGIYQNKQTDRWWKSVYPIKTMTKRATTMISFVYFRQRYPKKSGSDSKGSSV
jgi:hypothetical protein